MTDTFSAKGRFGLRRAPVLGALLMVLFVAFLAGTVQAAQLSALQGLETARKAFAGINDFSAELTQEKQIALMKKKMVSTGTVRFKRPGIFFMEIDPPHASRLLLKDNVINMYLPEEKIRQKTVLPPEEGLLRWFTLLDKPVTSVPAGMEVKAEKKGDLLLLTIRPASGKGVRELQLAVHEDGRPQRLTIEERNRDRTVMTFRKVRKNVGLTEKDFRIE